MIQLFLILFLLGSVSFVVFQLMFVEYKIKEILTSSLLIALMLIGLLNFTHFSQSFSINKGSTYTIAFGMKKDFKEVVKDNIESLNYLATNTWDKPLPGTNTGSTVTVVAISKEDSKSKNVSSIEVLTGAVNIDKSAVTSSGVTDKFEHETYFNKSFWTTYLFWVAPAEEFIKIAIAFILFLLFSSSVRIEKTGISAKEFLPYIFLASISFAIMENLLYFTGDLKNSLNLGSALGVMAGRFVLPVVTHLAFFALVSNFMDKFDGFISWKKFTYLFLGAIFLHANSNVLLSSGHSTIAFMQFCFIFYLLFTVFISNNTHTELSPNFFRNMVISGLSISSLFILMMLFV